jgi:hypothetical protein
MRRKVNVKRVDLKRLYKELFIKLDKVYEKIKRKKGRPKKYKESLIYFAFAFKVARNLSYRDLEHQLKEINLFDKIPNFSSIFYRFKHLNELLVGYFIKKIANLIKNFNKIKYSLIDATGFGYDDSFKLKMLRGKELRKVKSHIRLEAIVSVTNKNYTFIDGFYLDKAYSNENKMLFNLLKNYNFSSKYIMADALYSTVKFAQYALNKKLIPIIPTKDTLHTKIRNKFRKILQNYYENNRYIYKKRNLIENFFAKIKNSFSDKENTKNFNMAKKFILMKLLLVNFATLEAILLLLYSLFFKHSQKVINML